MSGAPTIAMVGNPNAGKSALFNALTGARQKVGNYPGVTVERKVGRLALADGRAADVVDLPGTYSLDAKSPDEEVTRNVIFGYQEGEKRPDLLVIVLDAANLDNHLRFTLELLALGIPSIVALNMVDLATRDGLELDAARLSEDLGIPVIPTVAVRRRGLDHLRGSDRSGAPGPCLDARRPDRAGRAGRSHVAPRGRAHRAARYRLGDAEPALYGRDRTASCFIPSADC